MTVKYRHPERSEGSPSAGTVPRSGDPSLHSGGRFPWLLRSYIYATLYL